MFGVIIWWWVSAHKWFKGPKVNVEHLMIGRQGNVVEGQEEGKGNDSSSELRKTMSKGTAEAGAVTRL